MENKDFMALFYGWDSTASRLEPLWGGSLLFPIKFPEIGGTYFLSNQEVRTTQIPKSGLKEESMGPYVAKMLFLQGDEGLWLYQCLAQNYLN